VGNARGLSAKFSNNLKEQGEAEAEERKKAKST